MLSASAIAMSKRNRFVHEVIARDFTSLEGFDVYLGGPPPMVDAATETALSLRAARSNIHADPFYPAPDRQSEGGGMLRAISRVLGPGGTHDLDERARRG